MKFKYSVIFENTDDARKWLEKVGYNRLGSDKGNILMSFIEGHFGCFELEGNIGSNFNDSINCIGNSPLFKAVSAMREDSDYMQWFTDGKEWFLCKRDEFRGYSEFSNSYPEFWGYNYHKATLTELQERFKEKEK